MRKCHKHIWNTITSCMLSLESEPIPSWPSVLISYSEIRKHSANIPILSPRQYNQPRLMFSSSQDQSCGTNNQYSKDASLSAGCLCIRFVITASKLLSLFRLLLYELIYSEIFQGDILLVTLRNSQLSINWLIYSFTSTLRE